MTSTVTAIADALGAGHVAVIPTDTVYGLAGLPTNPGAVARIFSLKGRLQDKPLPVLGNGVIQLEAVARFDDLALRLAEAFWPGPLTIVLPRAPGFAADLGGSQPDTVAVRVPDRELCLSLLGATGPLAVTSANLSGRPPATTAEQARGLFDSIPVLDGGACDGSPSTIVSLVGSPKILRSGPLEKAVVQALTT
ncbi:MAG: L-threonylcarbamoyladenylate synthase [Actinomycetota bacterium]|nr:L-threonylcarbamoyladenylate synthase [Actinomycetota bacterium]